MQPDSRLKHCVKALTLCAEKFEAYADHHKAKGDTDRAITNKSMAVMCRETIEKAQRGEK